MDGLWIGIAGVAALIVVWLIVVIVLRGRGAASDTAPGLDAADAASAREALSAGRDAAAVAMAARSAQSRQGR